MMSYLDDSQIQKLGFQFDLGFKMFVTFNNQSNFINFVIKKEDKDRLIIGNGQKGNHSSWKKVTYLYILKIFRRIMFYI